MSGSSWRKCRTKQRTERLDYHLASPVRANSNQGTDSLPGRSHEAACDVLVVDVDRDHLCGKGLQVTTVLPSVWPLWRAVIEGHKQFGPTIQRDPKSTSCSTVDHLADGYELGSCRGNCQEGTHLVQTKLSFRGDCRLWKAHSSPSLSFWDNCGCGPFFVHLDESQHV